MSTLKGKTNTPNLARHTHKLYHSVPRACPPRRAHPLYLRSSPTPPPGPQSNTIFSRSICTKKEALSVAGEEARSRDSTSCCSLTTVGIAVAKMSPKLFLLPFIMSSCASHTLLPIEGFPCFTVVSFHLIGLKSEPLLALGPAAGAAADGVALLLASESRPLLSWVVWETRESLLTVGPEGDPLYNDLRSSHEAEALLGLIGFFCFKATIDRRLCRFAATRASPCSSSSSDARLGPSLEAIQALGLIGAPFGSSSDWLDCGW
mmetsp:Transcript_33741/g.82271  ORF Transcript_33741/g.82271 Transcript_33741/m.82271 type:complete len:262 (-) Transcript_33741:718-1503(-)